MVNLPINDQLTIRGVVYVDKQGGYIDNVTGTRDARKRSFPTGRHGTKQPSRIRRPSGFSVYRRSTAVNFLEADNGTRRGRSTRLPTQVVA